MANQPFSGLVVGGTGAGLALPSVSSGGGGVQSFSVPGLGPVGGAGRSTPGSSQRSGSSSSPDFASPGGNYQGSVGFSASAPRILPVLIQRLAGAADFYAASTLIPFPFILRSLYLWAPQTSGLSTSDGTIDPRYGTDNTLTAAAFNQAESLLFSPGIPRSIYCASPVSFAGLWEPFPEGHVYLLAHCASLGGATNIQCVCWAGITPMADIEGV